MDNQFMDQLTVFYQSPIKGAFFIHFQLLTWALITTPWMPNIFLMYNMLFFICLLWSLNNVHNPEPVQLASIINLMSIPLDIMSISTNYNPNPYKWFGFSLFLIIINLIIRPVTSFVLLRVYNERKDRFSAYGSGFDSSLPPTSSSNRAHNDPIAAASRIYHEGSPFQSSSQSTRDQEPLLSHSVPSSGYNPIDPLPPAYSASHKPGNGYNSGLPTNSGNV